MNNSDISVIFYKKNYLDCCNYKKKFKSEIHEHNKKGKMNLSHSA